MNALKVKICGIRSINSADIAINDGADFLGFNFVTSSRRYIHPSVAQKIAKKIKGKSKIIGIFQNASISEVTQITKKLQLDFVQLHGEEDSTYCKKIKAPIIKKITLQKTLRETKASMHEYRNVVDIFLVDRPIQGKGPIVDLKQVKKLAKEYSIMLAGGLDNQNIEPVLIYVGKNLFGVDVSSGIESSPGKKNKELIHSFIKKVRRIYE